MPAPPYRFRTDIEGLRAVAVVLVVGYHVGAPFFSGGFVGVDVFFVLSGYLITWLLAREVEATGRIDVARFYARRVRRLVPALGVVLVATGLLAFVLAPPHQQVRLGWMGGAAALYVSNLVLAVFQSDYFASWTRTSPFLHTWSLGVEEQFYLVWPFLLTWVARARREAQARPVLWLGLVTAASFVGCVAVSATAPTWAFYLSPTRAWQFGVGGLAVLVPLSRRETPRRLEALGWAGLAGLALATLAFDRATVYPGVAALLPTLATAAILRSGRAEEGTALGRLLSLPPMREIGRLSYGWYLWHWPLLALGVSAFEIEGEARVAVALVALALAKASYHLVEAPIRYHPALRGRARRTLVGAAAVTVALAAAAGAWSLAAEAASQSPAQRAYRADANARPSLSGRDCITPSTSAEARECAYGDAEAPRTVLLLGDSQAASWFPLLEPLAESGAWQVVTLVRLNCPFVDRPLYSPLLGRRDTACETWREAATRRAEALAPDLVVLGMGTHYGFSAEDWTGGLTSALGPVLESSGRVLILDRMLAPQYDVPACLARRAWLPALARPCPPADERRYEIGSAALSEAARRLPNAGAFDLTPILCGPEGCPVERDGRPVYRDGVHVANWVAESGAPAFARHLEATGLGVQAPPVPPRLP